MGASPATSLRSVSLGGAVRAARPRGEVEHFVSNPDLVHIENLQVPNDVRPGDSIPISFDIRVDNFNISVLLDPDDCLTPGLLQGIRLTSTVRQDGGFVDSKARCVQINGRRNVTFETFAPADTTATEIEIVVETTNSGNEMERVSRTVNITEAAESPQDRECLPGFTRDPDTGECVPIEEVDGDGGGGGGGGDSVQEIVRGGAILLGLTAIVLLLGNLSD